MMNITSIEEIVKHQQELLNYQRNQKQIQTETLKLLNVLNKNIMFMSDRLDEFASKTNIKLENTLNIQNTSTPPPPTTTSSFVLNSNSLQCLNELNNSNEIYFNNNFYDAQFNTTNVNSTNGMVLTNSNEEIKEYYILSDCNLEPLQMQHQQPQRVVTIRQDEASDSTDHRSSPCKQMVNKNNTVKLLDVGFYSLVLFFVMNFLISIIKDHKNDWYF
jgi:hypothetical protein